MKINVYLKLVVALFAAMPCFADGVNTIRGEDGARLVKFNTNPLDTSLYEPHTAKINGILKAERNVTDRPASDGDKETILKAVMASVVIHGFDARTTVFDKRSTLTTGTMLGKHFEILRLTEELAGGLMTQLSTGFVDISALAGYENLYGFSGMGVDVFKGWFEDVVSKHSPGLMSRRVDGLRSDVKSVKAAHHQDLGVSIFGDIGEHKIAGRNVVFVSTYNMMTPCVLSSVLIRIPGENRYIVIERPYFDDSKSSPYTIRAHALINGEAQPRNVNVNMSIASGRNGKSEVGIANLGGGSVHSHDGTFSPNNMWLTHLPERSLQKGEAFSFVSKINGDGKMIDTLHVIAYDAYEAVKLAENTSNLGGFLQRLSRAHEIFGAETLSHLAKMMAFIEGRI